MKISSWAAALAAAIGALFVGAAEAKPRDPEVFRTPPADPGGPEWVFDLSPEYRWRLIHIESLDINGNNADQLFWGEQRLRLDVTAAKPGIGAVFFQADVLDGVLFGDNGEFGGTPGVTSGVGLTSKQPNASGWAIGLLDGRRDDALDIGAYGPTLREVDLIQINWAYAEVLLPFGVLRVGRQPFANDGTVYTNDGRSGRNRWGVSWYHSAADRILFGTKISEAFHMLADPEHVVDRSQDSGVFIGMAYDFLVMDQTQVFSDDLMQVGGQLLWVEPSLQIGSAELRDIKMSATLTYRFEDRFNTKIWGIPLFVSFGIGPVDFRGEYLGAFGSSREIAVGFSELTNQPVTDQTIEGHAARVVVDVEVWDFTLSAEWGFSSGDADPRSSTALTTFSWPRDTNLGMLLFEHIVSFQSARSAAVGIENLRALDSPSFPLTEVATDGRATNVNAFFPQIFYDPLDNLRLKAGVLLAWSHTDIVDPIQTSLAWDGERIDDDAVNYWGGKPGRYWGTEIDLGFEYRYADFMEFVLEGAYLIPGDGLKDENGDAQPAWMVESRFVFTL
jgi:hypothetical protein